MGTAATIQQLTSQGLARLVAGRGARMVVALLIIGLGLDSALLLTRLLDPAGTAPPALSGTAPTAARTVNPQLALATIVNAHLFGAAATSAGLDAPPTTASLFLAGVIADADPSRGEAIIGASAASAKLYAVGAAIPGGVRLHAVYRDRVLLERNGGLETLMLPRTPLPGAAGLAPTATPLAAARTNPGLLAGLVRVQPVFSQGRLSGYRIFPGPARNATAAFSQLGLRPGDLIVAVNGTSLDDPSRALEVLQTLSSADSATVTVSRNGAQQEVNLDLATLSTEEQQDDGAQGAAAAAAGTGSAPPGGTPARRFRGLPPPNGFGAAGPSPAGAYGGRTL